MHFGVGDCGETRRGRVGRYHTQSRAYRDFDLSQVKTESDAFLLLSELMLGERKAFACPQCGENGAHYLIRTRKQWRCRGCHATFSPTSGTAFHKRKISCLKVLQALKLFASGSNGVSASQAAAILDVDHRTAWLLFSKIREAFVLTADTTPMTGTVQADGGHFCGKPRRPNRRSQSDSVAVNAKLKSRKAAIDPKKRPTDREPWNLIKLRKRRIVLAIRELGATGTGAVRTAVAVLHSENAASAIPAIKGAVAAGATIMTDSGSGYSGLVVEYNHLTVRACPEFCV
jgi:transposase-like protein